MLQIFGGVTQVGALGGVDIWCGRWALGPWCVPLLASPFQVDNGLRELERNMSSLTEKCCIQSGMIVLGCIKQLVKITFHRLSLHISHIHLVPRI